MDYTWLYSDCVEVVFVAVAQASSRNQVEFLSHEHDKAFYCWLVAIHFQVMCGEFTTDMQ